MVVHNDLHIHQLHTGRNQRRESMPHLPNNHGMGNTNCRTRAGIRGTQPHDVHLELYGTHRESSCQMVIHRGSDHLRYPDTGPGYKRVRDRKKQLDFTVGSHHEGLRQQRVGLRSPQRPGYHNQHLSRIYARRLGSSPIGLTQWPLSIYSRYRARTGQRAKERSKDP